VTLRANSHTLSLSVSDTGRGFDEAAAANQGGLGLASMCERLRLIDGELTIRTQPGGGTEIVACVPISRASSTPAAERTGVA
jgi:signal transduction histidine kinase